MINLHKLAEVTIAEFYKHHQYALQKGRFGPGWWLDKKGRPRTDMKLAFKRIWDHDVALLEAIFNKVVKDVKEGEAIKQIEATLISVAQKTGTKVYRGIPGEKMTPLGTKKR